MFDSQPLSGSPWRSLGKSVHLNQPGKKLLSGSSLPSRQITSKNRISTLGATYLTFLIWNTKVFTCIRSIRSDRVKQFFWKPRVFRLKLLLRAPEALVTFLRSLRIPSSPITIIHSILGCGANCMLIMCQNLPKLYQFTRNHRWLNSVAAAFWSLYNFRGKQLV